MEFSVVQQEFDGAAYGRTKTSSFDLFVLENRLLFHISSPVKGMAVEGMSTQIITHCTQPDGLVRLQINQVLKPSYASSLIWNWFQSY